MSETKGSTFDQGSVLLSHRLVPVVALSLFCNKISHVTRVPDQYQATKC